MVWAAATLGVQPGPAFMEALLAAALSSLPQFGPQSLAIMLWALATLGLGPGDEWMARYAGASCGILVLNVVFVH